jgi:lipopolysaccharide transport system permease protein
VFVTPAEPATDPTPAPRVTARRPHLVLEPRRAWAPLNLRELWRHRELLWFLGLRDVQVRYKQTALGAAWALIQPLFTMLVFTLFFGKLAKLEKDLPAGLPYMVFVLAALLPWQLFSFALTQSSTSLVNNRNLITKVYFPRLLVPLAPLLCGLVDFAIAFVMLIALMLGYGVVPGWAVLTLPLFLLLALATSLAIGLWLSALNAVYRDVQYTLPFLAQIWMFASPVAYSSEIVPVRWQWLYGLNPMAGVIDGFRWALLGTGELSLPLLAASTASVIVLLIGGLYYFRSMETYFADLV